MSSSQGDDAFDALLRGVAASPKMVPLRAPREGDVLADRFVVERLARAGGMGTVYRAIDRMTADPVALKVVGARRETERARFLREAQMLAGLIHPAVVRYIAHGEMPDGQLFLAMEWLDGEDAADRLARAGLTVDESVTLARSAAEGLAVAHARGIVHRDVKPSNLFLPAGDVARVKVLDFGIARLEANGFAETEPPMTRTGAVVGTVGYMSPEQATGAKDIDARADVFALGCVLFECLTGQPAFSGGHILAVMGKVLREEAPRVCSLRPELPYELDVLVASMLAKDRDARPPNASVVVEILGRLGALHAGTPDRTRAPAEGLAGGEQRWMTVILALEAGDVDSIRGIVERFGGELAPIANGATLVTLARRGPATEQVVAAVSCALALRETFPLARVALATGRVLTSGQRLVGPVIDRAAALLAEHARGAGVRVDEVTAGLLDPRYEVRLAHGARWLVGTRGEGDAPRTLLGRATPFVGREKELALLEATFDECAAEPIARAVLVTAPAGGGKSRLRHELLGRLTRRRNVGVLFARGDPVGAGSALGVVRQLVRHAAGLREGEPVSKQHAALRGHLERFFAGDDLVRAVEFLGELVGAPTREDPSPELRTARNDARVMSDWLRRVFHDWLGAETRARPVVVVLEDLHWGDLPSIDYLDDGLRRFANRPLLVFGLARPEVHELFPKLWGAAGLQEIRLGGLTRSAAERLVRAALGDASSPDTVSRIVERAEGNAFYLEELIRCVAEGDVDVLPETVLVLAQSRLERLEADARRVLRAASIFGELFWEGGVSALVGGSVADGVGDWLRSLVAREVLVRSSDSKFPEQREYAFRHGLLREAAYAALTDADRTTGHRLAGEWLERMGELDVFVLAEHFERAKEPARAIPLLARAAQTALDGGSAVAPLAIAERAVAMGAAGVDLGRIRMIESTAFAWHGESDAGLESAREAVRLLPRGSPDWFRAAAIVVYASSTNADPSASVEIAKAIGAMEREAERSGPYAQAAFLAYIALRRFGQVEAARAIRGSFETAGDADVDEPRFLGYRALVFSWSAWPQDPARCLNAAREAKVAFERAADLRGLATACFALGWRLSEAGAYEVGERHLRDAIAYAQRAESRTPREWATVLLGIVRGRRGAKGEALDILGELAASGDAYVAMVARCEMGFLHLTAGDPKRAARELESLDAVAKQRGSGVVALTLVALGDPRGALEFCERGIDSIAPLNHSRLVLARASALHALGEFDAARSYIAEARSELLKRAALFEDPVLRTSHLALYEHARTLDLARAWLGE